MALAFLITSLVAASVLAGSTSAGAVGPATKLAFTTQPSDGVPNTPFAVQPVVEIQDADGLRVVSDDTTVVTLTVVPDTGGAGTVTCAPATATAVDGVATFTGCAIDALGLDYQLRATSAPVLTQATSNALDILPQRIFGTDAIDTAIAVSNKEFPASESAGAVVLARSDFFTDALAGGPLAADNDAPMLITPGASMTTTLDVRVRNEIVRVLPSGSTVYVLGGTLRSRPRSTPSSPASATSRCGSRGLNQFATAVAIATVLGNPTTIFEATGLHFADALSAVPAAIDAGGAILLTNGPKQAPETAAYLAIHPSARFAIGGPLAAAGADPSAVAVFGQDLYGTSAAVASAFFPDPDIFGVATGVNFPDALAGGVFMATDGRLGPMLLVNTHTPLPPTIATYTANLDADALGYVFGGPIAVGEDVLVAIAGFFSD